MQGFFIDKMSN